MRRHILGQAIREAASFLGFVAVVFGVFGASQHQQVVRQSVPVLALLSGAVAGLQSGKDRYHRAVGGFAVGVQP
jgi:hypothetical protein